MNHIANTNFHASIWQNVPVPWREIVLWWVQLKLRESGLVPSIHLNHDLTRDHTPGELWFVVCNPSYEFYCQLPYPLKHFDEADSVKIAFDNTHQTVIFSGTGKWGHAYKRKPKNKQ